MTNPHIHSHTQAFVSTIETASSMDFLPLLSPDYFRVATPKLASRRWITGAQLSLRHLAGVKKALCLWLSHPGIQVRPTVGPGLMKRLCSCGHVGRPSVEIEARGTNTL